MLCHLAGSLDTNDQDHPFRPVQSSDKGHIPAVNGLAQAHVTLYSVTCRNRKFFKICSNLLLHARRNLVRRKIEFRLLRGVYHHAQATISELCHFRTKRFAILRNAPKHAFG